MSETEDAFLRRSLKHYREPEKTRREVNAVTNHYKGLKPVGDTFVFNNGTTKQLVVLKGTIPVSYRGATYHIPVALWLLDTHPMNAPMAFVTPTPNMRIKVSRHVDHNGKVYLPYLHDWNPNSSEILDLIQVMIITFQEQPPVYSVPPQQQQQQQQQQQGLPYPMAQPFGAVPYPVGGPGGMPMPGGVSSPTPYPPVSANQQQQQQPAFSIRPSLISASEEKLKRKLEDAYLGTEIIKKTGEELKKGQSRLEMMLARLQDERRTLEGNIGTLEKEVALLEGKIATSSEEEGKANIDDAIQAPTPLHRQIVQTAAEEAALDDTLYYLGEALRTEKIDLEAYLRTVRQVSRRQFTQRALLRKCRLKAGLAG